MIGDRQGNRELHFDDLFIALLPAFDGSYFRSTADVGWALRERLARKKSA